MQLATLAAESCQAVITSPPYYSLRDYGTEPLVWGGDAGHEPHEWGLPVLGMTKDAQRATNGRGVVYGRGTTPSSTNASFTKVHGSTCPCGAWLGSLGLEPTPELYIEHLVSVFREVRRVLHPTGTCWVNLGDSYNGNGVIGRKDMESLPRPRGGHRTAASFYGSRPDAPGLKPKDLMEMPSRLAMALQADGWYLRSRIPWLKRNCMPESANDRPTNAVEYVFLLSKSSRYFWDAEAVRVAQSSGSLERFASGRAPRIVMSEKNGIANTTEVRVYDGPTGILPTGRSRRNSDWFMESWQGLMLDDTGDPLAFVVNPQPFSGAHFATFPPKLVEPMVKASTSEKGQCPECGAPTVRVVDRQSSTPGQSTWNGAAQQISKGLSRPGNFVDMEYTTVGWRPSCAHTAEPVPQVILDPFSGAGTVLLCADRLGRNGIGIDLKPSYSEMAIDRLKGDGPMFLELSAD